MPGVKLTVAGVRRRARLVVLLRAVIPVLAESKVIWVWGVAVVVFFGLNFKVAIVPPPCFGSEMLLPTAKLTLPAEF